MAYEPISNLGLFQCGQRPVSAQPRRRRLGTVCRPFWRACSPPSLSSPSWFWRRRLPRLCGPVRSVPSIAVAGSTRRRSLLEAAEQTSTKMRCRWVRRAIAGPKSRSSGSIGSRGRQGPLDVGSGSGQALRSGRVLRSLRRCVCTASEEVRGAIGLRHGVDLRSTGRSLTGRANAATVAPVFIW